MTPAIEHRVRDVIASLFNLSPEELTLDSSQRDVPGWDSIQQLNVVLALEQEFELRFAPEEIERMVTIRVIVNLLEDRLQRAPFRPEK